VPVTERYLVPFPGKGTRYLLLVWAVLAGCAAMVRDPDERVPSIYGDGEIQWKGRTVTAARGVLVLKFRSDVPQERQDYLLKILQLKPARSYYLPADEAVQVIFPETWQKTLDDLLTRPEIEWVHPDLPTDQF